MERVKPTPAGALLLLFVVCMVAAALYTPSNSNAALNGMGSGDPQRMELSGLWLGMRVADSHVAAAQEWGIAPGTEGVLVTELAPGPEGFRAREGGVLPGDLITAADGRTIVDLASLYDASRSLDVTGVVLIEVNRRGQQLTLALPSLTGMSGPAMALATPTPPWPTQQAMSMPFASWSPPSAMPASTFPGQNQPVGAPASPQFVCPVDGIAWPLSMVHPSYRCPKCNQPLVQM